MTSILQILPYVYLNAKHFTLSVKNDIQANNLGKGRLSVGCNQFIGEYSDPRVSTI